MNILYISSSRGENVNFDLDLSIRQVKSLNGNQIDRGNHIPSIQITLPATKDWRNSVSYGFAWSIHYRSVLLLTRNSSEWGMRELVLNTAVAIFDKFELNIIFDVGMRPRTDRLTLSG